MAYLRKNKILPVLLVLVFSIGFFLSSAGEARAQGIELYLFGKLAAWWAGKAVNDAFIKGVLGLLHYGLSALVYFLEFVTKAVDGIIHYRVGGSAAIVGASWEIIRNFANMFFIVILIVMAFATIFDVGSFGFPGYDVSSLIARFLVAALLINFSLVIGGLLISGADTINSVFLASIGDFGKNILDSLRPAQIVDAANSAETPAQLMASLIFSIFLFILIIGCMLIALVVSIIRIPILWLLLIFSPLAWLTSILPATRNMNQKWWKEFIRWNLFLPVFLLVMYIGMRFLAGQEAVISAGAASTTPGSLESIGFGLSTVFYYMVAGFIFAGGTAMALSGGLVAGIGGITAATKTRDALTGGFARFTGATALRGAAGERLAQIQKEGLPGRARFLYGGQAALDRQQAAFAGRLGVRGATDKMLSLGRDRIKDIENDPAKLKAAAQRGSGADRIAALARLRELGEATSDDTKLEYKLLNTIDRTGIKGREMAEKLDYSKMSEVERKEWSTLGDISVKKKVALAQIEKGELKTQQDLEAAAKLYANSGDQRNFLEQAKKKNLVAATNAMQGLGLLAPGRTAGQEIADSVGKMGKTQLLELDGNTISDPAVQRALEQSFEKNPKLRDTVLADASLAQRTALEPVLIGAAQGEAAEINRKVTDLMNQKRAVAAELGLKQTGVTTMQAQIDGEPDEATRRQFQTRLNEFKKKEVAPLENKINKIDTKIENLTG